MNLINKLVVIQLEYPQKNVIAILEKASILVINMLANLLGIVCLGAF
jgi:hypothetical protein